PAFLSILQSPGAPLVGIEDLRLHQVFQGVKILLQIEDAIAQLIIEALTVQLAAVFQAVRKRLLGHARVENLAFELVDGGILSMQRRPGKQNQDKGADAKSVHVGSPTASVAAIQSGESITMIQDRRPSLTCVADGRFRFFTIHYP